MKLLLQYNNTKATLPQIISPVHASHHREHQQLLLQELKLPDSTSRVYVPGAVFLPLVIPHPLVTTPSGVPRGLVVDAVHAIR